MGRSTTVTAALVVAILGLTSCAQLQPREVQLVQQSRYGELERLMRSEIPDPGTAPFSRLFYLCFAQSRVKRYGEMFACAEHLQRKIDGGDSKLFAFDFSSAPALMRAEASIELGDYERAVAEAGKAYALVQGRNAYLQMRIYAISALALAHALKGDRAEAIRLAAELERVDTSYPNTLLATDKYIGLAKTHIALGQYDRALAAIQRDRETEGFRQFVDVLTGASLTGESLFTYWVLPKEFMLNKALLETGNVAGAKAGFDRLLAMPQTRDNGDIHWVVLFDRGRIAETEGKLDEALEYYRRAIEIIEAQRSTINTEASKIGFVGDKRAVYHRAIRLLVARGDGGRAFEYVERSKARALVDLLAGKQDFAAASDAGRDVGALVRALDAAEVAGRVQDADAPADLTRRRATSAEIKERLRTTASELASLVTVTAITAGEIQARLPAGTDLVEFYYHGDDLYAFVVSPGGVRTVRLDGAGLADEVRRFRAALEDPGSNEYLARAQSLHRRLLAPVEAQLRHRSLLIVPHGVLHYLPVNALHDGSAYVIDRFTVRLLPSASVLRYLKGRPVHRVSRALVLGNPDLADRQLDLRFAEIEAREVAKAFAEAKVLLRREATRTAFQTLAPTFGYIHLATHGRFDSDSPLDSGLLLVPEGSASGVLTVGDLYTIRLSAELVTLSACETGLGKLQAGDELVGLTRGFLYAGANAIVASLWPVADRATAELMVAFYANLARADKATALREAQLAVKARRPHPFFWAPFQLTGGGG